MARRAAMGGSRKRWGVRLCLLCLCVLLVHVSSVGAAVLGQPGLSAREKPTKKPDVDYGDERILWGYRWMTQAQYELYQKGILIDGTEARGNDQGKKHSIGHALYFGNKVHAFKEVTVVDRPWICAFFGPANRLYHYRMRYIPYGYVSKFLWRKLWQTDWKGGTPNGSRRSVITTYLVWLSGKLYGMALPWSKAYKTIRVSAYWPRSAGKAIPGFYQMAVPPERAADIVPETDVECSRDPDEVDKGDVDWFAWPGEQAQKLRDSWKFGRKQEADQINGRDR